MNTNTVLKIFMGSFFTMSASAFADPGVNVRFGLVQTDITAEIGDDFEESDDYLGIELNGTLSLDQIYVSGELKTSLDDNVELDVFSLMGGYRLNDQASVFLGYKSLDYIDNWTADGFFAGYSHLIPIESMGSAVVLSGALGFLTAELEGVSGIDSDPALGYNLKASYLYPLNDRLTVAGDFAVYSYTYNFKGNGRELELKESNLAFGVSVSYEIQ